MNNDKHKLIMLQVLKEIFKDEELRDLVAFKGGTALMFFHYLPRFSVDLDFNILDAAKKELVYNKVRDIALKYGTIADEQLKFFGPLIVLNYEKGERNLKLELSTRFYDNHYEMKNLAGTDIVVMKEPDMFAHKLCALLDRGGMTGRDVVDIHFFLSRQTPVHAGIVEQRMQTSLTNYFAQCQDALSKANIKDLMANVGEFLDGQMKADMKSGKLIEQTIEMLEERKFIPLIAEYPKNEMPIEKVEIVTSLSGEAKLSAHIGNRLFSQKTLSPSELQTYAALPKDTDKENFLCHLAKDSYYNSWKRNETSEMRTLKR